MKRFLTGAASALLAVAAGSAAGITPHNYDRQAMRAPVAGAAKAQALERRLAARTSQAAHGSRILWADAGGPALPLSPMRSDVRPEAAARNALSGAAGRLGLPQEAVDAAELKELQDLGHGPVIARFTQKYQGLEVFGREMKVVMDRNLRPVAYSSSFVPLKGGSPLAASKAAPSSYSAASSLTAGTAVTRALRDLSRASGAPGLQLLADAKPSSVWYADRGAMIPAYKLRIRAAQADGAGILSYGYLVSAKDGEVLVRKNFTAEASYSYRVYAASTSPFAPGDGPLGNARIPFPGANPGDNPARVPVSPVLVTLQNGPISTMDPWLATGATVTNGNNVDAYSDINPPDGINNDQRATMSAAATFGWVATADADPTTVDARRGGVVNLFYLDNYLHDLWYDHGMTETAGNAQHVNYQRGGVNGDEMVAQTQDFSGRNNANMDTPPDGISPTQQMYLFDGGTHSFAVTAPALGAYESGIAGFGSTAFDMTGDLAAVNDGSTAAGGGTGTVTDGCEAFSGVSGKIALVDRGACTFVVKGSNAQAAGAIGMLVVNNVPQDGPVSMGGTDPSITIPVMSVSIEDGDTIKNALGSGTVTVHMVRAAGADRDSALDNGIAAHEFFHYISNRLIGDAFGLNNQQGNGMGEGWSDFDSMLLMVRPDDTAVPGNSTYAGIYGLGEYVDDSAYYGIRRAPYSTDFSINPLTFQHIQEGVPLPNTAPFAYGHDGVGNSEVHATGEIWANVLWECYAALLNNHTFTDARSRMMDYIIAGLKMTPDSPTMLDARDAILAAVRAADAQDYTLFATAFAKRGMGAGAVAPDAFDDQQLGVVESYIALAQSYKITTPAINFQYDDGTVGYCDTDNVLDPGETALLSFTVTSDGTQDLAAGATIQVSTDGNVTLPNGGLVTLPALPIGTTFDVNMPMTLASASSTAQLVTLTVAFPPAGGTPDAVIEPPTYTQALHVNFDLSKTRTFDDVELPEASESDWQVALTDASGRRWTTVDADADYHTGRMWYAPDNGTPNTSTLTSPSFHVNLATNFSLGFDHYFKFEVPFDTGSGTIYFDGGRIEVSVDGGAWQDAVAFGATFTQGNGYNGASLAFDQNNPPQAFVDTNGDIESMTLDFGTLLAGHNAQLRFRLESDESVGAFGWLVDNVTFTGASAPIFSTPVTEDGVCVNHLPLAHAGSDASANEGATVNLTGSATDRDGDTLTYAWTRLNGPSITINNPTTLTPSFVAPEVSAATPITLRLTVSDGVGQGTDDVVITVNDISVPPPPSGGGGGALGGFDAALLGLLALLRRRRE